MKYILILTFIFSNDEYRSGMGGAAISQQEYNNLAACESAGKYWKKYHADSGKLDIQNNTIEMWKPSYVCVPKGE